MKYGILFGLVIFVLFGVVLTAEKPQIVYIHYSTQQEAEEAQQKILAEFTSFGNATVVTGDDPSLSVANVTADATETINNKEIKKN